MSKLELYHIQNVTFELAVENYYLRESHSSEISAHNVRVREMKDFIELMHKRSQRVAHICNVTNSMNNSTDNFNELMLIKEKRILYCPIYKVKIIAYLRVLFVL